MKKGRRIRRYILVLLLALVCLTAALMWDHTPSAVEVFGTGTENGQEELKLYARSAVLLDADSGRILYGKNEDNCLVADMIIKVLDNIDLSKTKIYELREKITCIRELFNLINWEEY